MTRVIYCTKLKKQAEGLEHPPLPGVLGNKIFEQISKEAWQQWVNLQTMLINENRLSLIDPNARTFLSQEREKFLFGEGSEKPPGFTPAK